MKRLALAALFVALVAVPASAQVHVDIGIRLPGPPSLTIIPGVPVYYAPQAPANVFFYGHQYWVFNAGGWHVGPTWSGPWVVVAPVHVPAPILRVPVAYYKVPPGHWKKLHRHAPPRWEAHYGRDWREGDGERGWREREERWHHSKHKDRDRDHDHGRGRGHGKGH
jgi:hypothetical protein